MTVNALTFLISLYICKHLTAVPLVLHTYVLLVLAGILMELALVVVVPPIASTHRLHRLALAAKGTHALSRQAV